MSTSDFNGRITSVELQDFRGWGQRNGKPRRLKVDADLVLITGANGYGKSSLLEAILLALTGHRQHQPPTGVTSGWGDLCHRGVDGRSALAWRVALSLGDGRSASVGWTSNEADGDEAQRDRRGQLEDQSLNQAHRLPSALHAGALSYFQEGPRDGLDLAMGAANSSDRKDHRPLLYRWFVESSAEVNGAYEALLARSIQVEGQLRDGIAKRQRRPAEGFGKAIKDARAALALPDADIASDLAATLEVLNAAAVWQSDQDDRAAERDRLRAQSQLQRFAEEDPAAWHPDGVRGLVDTLFALVDGRADKLRSADAHALRQELFEVEARLQALRPNERMEEVLAWGEPGSGALALDTVLRGLANGVAHWTAGADVAHREGLGEIVEELRRLDTGKLSTWAQAVSYELQRSRHERDLRGQLERQRDELKARLEQADGRAQGRLIKQALRKVQVELAGELSHLRELRELVPEAALRTLLAELDDLLQRVDAARAESKQVEKQLDPLVHKLLDQTLVRFQPRPGFLPVRLKAPEADRQSELRVLTLGDGSTWADASTGQKAQLSLGWMLAQAMALQGVLPARVLLLDDTSTAFDQGNLARQVTWLRQLAYNDDPKQRWQIFLASHHDELTSRLSELLRPPDGHSLQVLDFTAWTQAEGPAVRSFELRPREQLEADLGAPAQRLEKALERMWDRPLGRPQPTATGGSR